MKARKLSCCFKNLLTPFQVSSRAAFKIHTSQHEPRIDELKWFKNGILAEERAILQNLSICKIQADKENRFNFPNAGSVSLLHYKRLSSTTLRHHSVLFVFQPPASFFFHHFYFFSRYIPVLPSRHHQLPVSRFPCSFRRFASDWNEICCGCPPHESNEKNLSRIILTGSGQCE